MKIRVTCPYCGYDQQRVEVDPDYQDAQIIQCADPEDEGCGGLYMMIPHVRASSEVRRIDGEDSDDARELLAKRQKGGAKP